MKLKVFYTLFICVAFSASSHAQLGDMLKGKRQGISGKLHKKYIGKIVFAPRENDIEYPGEVESNFKDKFNFGEEIFLRAYFESTLMDVTKEFSEGQSKSDKVAGARFAASFYLDGMLAHESTFGEGSALTAEQKYKSTYRGALIIKGKYPLSDGYLFQEEYKAFTSKVAEKLTPGEHKIKIDLYPEFSLKGATKRGAIMASGEFTLVVKKSVPDDPEMCIPLSSVGVDKALEKKIYDYFL
ncbi:hypothetical protein, partial [uncultured Flavobacterium sp.]|uniref:hypothetical protein n=1 Tax=uncultured Flavobacterium sp. TaxID=165435 RepID=UPI0025E70B96